MPARKNGIMNMNPSVCWPKNIPTIGNAMPSPICLATETIPLVPLLSADDTNIARYVCLAGNFIWEKEDLKIRKRTAGTI